MTNDLTVIYRAYGGELMPESFKAGRPSWFDKKKCYHSFFQGFVNKSEIHIVWDGYKENDLFKYIKQFTNQTIHEIDVRDNQKSLEYCYKLAEEIKTPFLCFTEDDYAWLPGSYEFMIDALKLNYNPLTLYNHPDRYINHHGLYIGGTDITLGKDLIGQTNYGYVRTCESTTCSFACSRDFFEFVKRDLYWHNNIGVGAPEDRKFWRNLYQKHNIRLWSALPGLSFHMSLPLPFEWEIKNEN